MVTTSVMSMPMVFAAPGGPNAPGNNGTVKIDGLDTSDNDSSNANDPHVACTFAVNFYNYDDATINATVSFALQNPTKDGRTITVTAGDETPTFDGTGQAGLDHSEQYTLAFTGAPQPNQGYHVKMTVHAPYSQGSDTKYKTFWVGPCITEPAATEVTPTMPTATEPTCENPGMVVTPPTIIGIIWSHATTTLKPGESVTFIATADTANNYVLKTGVQTEWHFTNNFDPSQCGGAVVTPAAPAATEPTCASPNMVVRLPESQTGVVWSPDSDTTLTPGQTVVYTAAPANGYSFTQGAQTTWEFKNNLNLRQCEELVKAGHVRFHEACGLERDYYVIPETAHVNYYVNGSVLPAAPGKHRVQSAGTVTITAEAVQGYTLVGDHIWSYTFTDADCPEKVKPPRVIFEDFCGTDDDLFIIPSRQGVEYRIDGQVIAAGEYPGNGTVTVSAFAKVGFKLKGTKTTWTHEFKNQTCSGEGGNGLPQVAPEAVSFKNLTCTAAGSYTVPATDGVAYEDGNGAALSAGTYPVLTAATVTVKAYAIGDAVELTGTTEWTHVFTVPKNCGHVLGSTTPTPTHPSRFVFVPGGKGAAQPELANTGDGTLAAAVFASLLTFAATAVHLARPRRSFMR
ncbi:MAG TPA: hypothetical protein VFL85_02900 [Candidatus Saccharimonadales bacterium]|nr:hypothetical protein [Candidatus Saccharimonadales bacterium]